jgi:hypothetical protein
MGTPSVVGCRQTAIAIALGLTAAADLLLASPQASAEPRIETSISPPPVSRPRAPARRPAAEAPEDESADMPAAPRRQGDGEEEENAEETSSAGLPTPAAVDGNASAPAGAQPPLDGIIEVGEQVPTLDGIPNLQRDARTAQDIAAFERPPAGYNPYLFQIELEPLTDRRTAQLFYMEPYFARGVRIGSFVIFPEAQFGAIATDNIFRNSARLADGGAEVGAKVRVVSDWRTHAVEFRASGLASFYDEFPTENDRSYALEARGRLDLTKRTNIEVLVLHQLDKDRRGLRDSPVAAVERGDIETDRFAFALNHRVNRLGLQLRGSVTDVDFAPVPSAGGGIISNAERNFTQRDAAFRASWALNGKLDVFAETAINDREFFVAPGDGILRSSTGERYRVGVTFAPWDTRIRGEVSAGWGRQSPKDGRLDDIEGIIVDANLAWRASALTTFLLTARSDFYDTTTTGSPGTLSRQVGLEARHAIRRHLIGTAAIRYTVNPYEGVSLIERDLTTELGLEYYLGRDTILYARYQHIAFDSTAPGSDYQADIVRVGVRVRQ